jgi:hypothetical protein
MLTQGKIICEWLAMPGPECPVVYHIQFSDETFKTEGVRMNIVDMMAAFDGVAVDLALALVDVPLPGVPAFDADKPLGENIEFSDAGFTLCRDFRNSRDLRLHGVFGKFSLVNIPDWRPFGEYTGKVGLEGFLGKIQIPTPSVRLCVQDLFRKTGARVSQLSSPLILASMIHISRLSSASTTLSRSATRTSHMRSRLALRYMLIASLSLLSVRCLLTLRHP